MIRIVLTTGVALVAFMTTASAADPTSRRGTPYFTPPPPIPVFSWTGFYIGVQAGYQFGSDNMIAVARGIAGRSSSTSPSGIIGGGHVGYNYTLPGVNATKLVVGIEGDVDGSGVKRVNSPFGGLTTASSDSNIKGSVRGRVGVTVDRVLFYATGGAAFADFQTRYDAPVIGAVDSYDRGRVGYTVGAGVEYAFMNNFSVRAEYRYSDYGTFTDALTTSAPGFGATISHHEKDNRVQAGLSYKFETIVPAAIVAKY